MLGSQVMWSKHKWHAHKYALKTGSLVHMVFDRPRETLSFSVDDKYALPYPPFSRNGRLENSIKASQGFSCFLVDGCIVIVPA